MAVKIKRQERFRALLRNLASSFIRKEIGLKILITVMRVEISDDLRMAKIFISAFPEEKEGEILELLKKKSWEFHDYLKTQLKMKFLPIVSFEIDKAIKIEREIEEVLKKARPRSQVVRQRSAKPLYAGANPTVASSPSGGTGRRDGLKIR